MDLFDVIRVIHDDVGGSFIMQFCWDEIGDYFERHVCRPMENIMTGSDVRDKEFFVPEEDEDE